MTHEEKQLLLKDLCGRLPYGVKVKNVKNNFDINTFNHNVEEIKFLIEEYNIKPYLRPMSSMTEEEYKSVSWEGCSHTYNYSLKSGFRFVEIKTFTLNILNWLNAHHFDYRGLIEKGLALEAPEDMYKEIKL